MIIRAGLKDEVMLGEMLDAKILSEEKLLFTSNFAPFFAPFPPGEREEGVKNLREISRRACLFFGEIFVRRRSSFSS